MGLTLDTVIKRDPDQIFNAVDSEVVMLNVDTGNYYSINHVGSYIWTMIEEPQTIGSCCNALVERYDVEAARCEAEVLVLLDQMIDEKLIIVDSPES